MRHLVSAFALVVATSIINPVIAADAATLTVHVDKPGVAISPTLYGIFFEEINRGGDGGLLAEMVENRSFEDGPGMNKPAKEPQSWTAVGGAQMALDTSRPLNDRNPTALRVTFTAAGSVTNAGFKGVGLALRKGESYRLSFYARCEGTITKSTARLEGHDGTVLAETVITGIGSDWKKIDLELTATSEALTGRMAIAGAGSGTLWLDMVSLTPAKTWKNHGMRIDLADKVAAMKPSFVRFPGGCFVEGATMPMAVRWKDTIGDPAQRKGNWCIWGYQTTAGFGVHEFFQWCEDLNAEPLYVINCGMSHKENVPMDKLDEYVQDAMDLLEYARGPADSVWGAKRAAAGHPAPFKLNRMEIGNENGGPIYHERYAKFHDAIKAQYPDVQLVACVWNGVPKNRPLDIIDEHYYNTPDFFATRAGMYDGYDRKGPKIYVGEYAVTRGCGQGNLIAGLGEAAYMTGLERNADHVVMASYAPLFVNPPWRKWNPNAIVFDQAQSYGTPSYHVQAMFGANRGDVVCPSDLNAPPVMHEAPAGGVGVGTWNTQAEFKDIAVIRDGKTLFSSDFTAGTKGWKFQGKGHQWSVVDGALRQSAEGEDLTARIGDESWGNRYALSLKARKISGKEGFLILFQTRGERHWLNLGGWGNTGHGFEIGGDDRNVPGTIEIGRWYDIRLEVDGQRAKAFLDGKLIQDVDQRRSFPSLFTVASRTDDGKELILKVVNMARVELATKIDIHGVRSVGATARSLVLTGAEEAAENSFTEPEKIAPKSGEISGVTPTFNHTFPASSVTVLRLNVEP